MPSDYSLPDVLERIYHNPLALEAAIMELTFGWNSGIRQR